MTAGGGDGSYSGGFTFASGRGAGIAGPVPPEGLPSFSSPSAVRERMRDVERHKVSANFLVCNFA